MCHAPASNFATTFQVRLENLALSEVLMEKDKDADDPAAEARSPMRPSRVAEQSPEQSPATPWLLALPSSPRTARARGALLTG